MAPSPASFTPYKKLCIVHDPNSPAENLRISRGHYEDFPELSDLLDHSMTINNRNQWDGTCICNQNSKKTTTHIKAEIYVPCNS